MSVVKTLEEQLNKLTEKSLYHLNDEEFAYFRPADIRAVIELAKLSGDACIWHGRHGDCEDWEPGCDGETNCFSDGDPLATGWQFCPYCGKRIELVTVT